MRKHKTHLALFLINWIYFQIIGNNNINGGML
jgi:hypothetical protein